MGPFAPEVVESGNARHKKYTKAAWCRVYSLARLWFERLRLSGRDSARSQRDEKEHESQQRAAIAAFLVASHHCDYYPRHDDKHDGREMGRRNRG